MNILSNKTYRNWLLLGLLVQVITAWFSVGYFHPDEHFQILEFYNYKRGLSPVADLPWEFTAQCRTALQPFIVYWFSRIAELVGVTSPFTLAFLLRLSMGVLTWFTTCRLIMLLTPGFKSPITAKLFVAVSMYLWFVPYIGVRFSAETIAANFFFLAISMMLQIKELAGTKRLLFLFLSGLLLGFTLFLRLQMGFAFLGLAVWVLFVSKWSFRDWFLLAFFAVIAMGLSVVVDHWFYGNWVLTPLNYFNVNIIQHVAAKFGVDPWWYYFVLFIKLGIAPISVPLLVLFLIGVWKKPLNLFTLVSITFCVGHFLIGHKEMRFLFPASYAFIYVACLGLDYLCSIYTIKKGYKIVFKVLAGVNIAVLVFKMFTPAEEVMKYYEFIYNYANLQPTTIVSFDKSPFKMDVIETNFYKPKNINIQVLHQPAELAEVFKNNIAGKPIIYLSNNIIPPKELDGYRIERIYCQFPDWVLKVNVNHWQERSYIWAVFRVYPK